MHKLLLPSLFVVILAAVPFRPSKAQDAPKYSNEFLAIGVGARALGMGSAYTSAVNDVTAGYWNPAGLLGVTGDLQVGVMHSEYFAGIAKYDYVGIAKPIDSMSTIGFTFVRFGIDNIPNTIDLIDPISSPAGTREPRLQRTRSPSWPSRRRGFGAAHSYRCSRASGRTLPCTRR